MDVTLEQLFREAEFAGLDRGWDEDVPELAGTLVYLRCRRASHCLRDWLMQPMR